MCKNAFGLWAAGWLASAPLVFGAVEVRFERFAADIGFFFYAVPLPANNDAATGAQFAVVDGDADPNGASLEALHDGALPDGGDQPKKNFFFKAGSGGGRIRVDLRREISVRRVGSYSWHPGARGPQVYTLYGSDGRTAGFNPRPARSADPAACGWTLLSRVDTRPKGRDGGGQYGVVIEDGAGVLGSFRYLLFDCEPAERRDPFGNTFYSEIDVVDANGPAPAADQALLSRKPVLLSFASDDRRLRLAIDVTASPDLVEWASNTLKPAVLEWYPKIVALLPSSGFQAPETLVLIFRSDMGNVPASASGECVSLNADWFRGELGREALGAVIHELVHVVQDYGQAGRSTPNPAPTPGWVVEGIADYVRWFLYEPQSRGAEITKGNAGRAAYDGSYRMSANFLDWVVRTYDRDLVGSLNAAAREGRYSEPLWLRWTEKSVQTLGEEWLAAKRKQVKEMR